MLDNACRVGRTCRYTDHVLIKTFHRKTALIQAGVLQRSADAVGPRLRVDFLGPSDAPLNRGGWAARKERQAAADAGAASGAPAGAQQAAPCTVEGRRGWSRRRGPSRYAASECPGRSDARRRGR